MDPDWDKPWVYGRGCEFPVIRTVSQDLVTWIDQDHRRLIVAVPKQRNSREENARIKAGETPAGWEDKPAKRRQKDVEARWTKKHGKSHGYKNHGGPSAQAGAALS